MAFIATLIQNPISAQPGESTTITTTTTTTTVAYVTPDETQGVDYMPKIHGVVRTRWEGEFIHGDFGQRFQVRNARVSVGGNILKSLSYFVQIDACDRGKFTFLDAYARWRFSKTGACKPASSVFLMGLTASVPPEDITLPTGLF